MRSLTEILTTGPILDPEEEAFVVFSQDIPSQSLGFIDSQDPTLEITVAGHDLVIHHSRGLLTSNRRDGTTGAMVWKVTPLFATWISSPTNFLFTNRLLTPSSTIIELGAGVSGIVALCLGPQVASYTATDQDYVLKLLRQNITENLDTVIPAKKKGGRGSKRQQSHLKNGGDGGGWGSSNRITTLQLDWETDATSQLKPVDMIIACDCVYNEALVEPLNATCAAICRLQGEGKEPTLCLVAQQLRSPEVFETWLKSFHRDFHVWQVPDEMLSEGLKEGSGFVVHVSVVR